MVFILLDAARADHFSYQGYARPTSPEIDAIAAQGVAFLRAYSQGATTRSSLPLIMTSRYFAQCIVGTFDIFPVRREGYEHVRPDPTRAILPSVFRAAAWKAVAFSAHAGITPASVFGRSFDKFVQIRGRKRPYPPARKVLATARRWISDHRDEKAFVYIHLMETHFPHYVTADTKPFLPPKPYPVSHFRRDGSPRCVRTALGRETTLLPRSFSERDRQYLNALYDGDVRSVSREIGAFWDWLEREGMTRNTVLVLTADHGEELGEHGQVTHFNGHGWDTLHHVPLLIVAPGKVPAGVRVSAPVESIDIVPTVLELAGIAPPAGKVLKGRSLSPLWHRAGSRWRPVFLVDYAGWGIRTREWLYYELLDGTKPRLYELRRDPGELHNVVSSYPGVAARLRRTLHRTLGPARRRHERLGWRQPTAPFAVPLEPEVLVGGPAVVSPDPGEARRRRDKMLHDDRWTFEPPRTFWAVGATEGPPPLEVSLKVPPATYRIAVGMGDGEIVLGPKAGKTRASTVRVKVDDEPGWRTVSSRSSRRLRLFAEPPWWAFWRRPRRRSHLFQGSETYVEIGKYRVTSGRLRLALATAPGAAAVVHEILFIPVVGRHTGQTLGHVDRERLDALRALGYVN